MIVSMITPDEIDLAELDRELSIAFTNLVEEAEVAFQLSYHNWDNKPDFYTTAQKERNWTVEYSTEDENYVRIDDGTEAHDISGNPFLKFKTPTNPKTSPGRLTSFSGFSSGGKWVTKGKVRHPGIDAREFSNQVLRVIEKSVEDQFDSAHEKTSSL